MTPSNNFFSIVLRMLNITRVRDGSWNQEELRLHLALLSV